MYVCVCGMLLTFCFLRERVLKLRRRVTYRQLGVRLLPCSVLRAPPPVPLPVPLLPAPPPLSLLLLLPSPLRTSLPTVVLWVLPDTPSGETGLPVLLQDRGHQEEVDGTV